MINRTVLVGRIVKTPEFKYTSSNIPYVRFTLAVNRRVSKDGEREADFISCIAWRNQATNMSNYVKKGDLLGVEGRIQTGSYDDNNGVKHYTTDVVCDSVQFLEPKSKDTYQDVARNEGEHARRNSPSIEVNMEDLPF